MTEGSGEVVRWNREKRLNVQDGSETPSHQMVSDSLSSSNPYIFTAGSLIVTLDWKVTFKVNFYFSNRESRFSPRIQKILRTGTV